MPVIEDEPEKTLPFVTERDNKLILYLAEEIDPGAWSQPHPSRRKNVAFRAARRALNAMRKFQADAGRVAARI